MTTMMIMRSSVTKVKFGSRNQKLFMFKFQYQGREKQKSGKNIWVTKRGNKGITNSGQVLGATNRVKKITNQGRDFKSVQEGVQFEAGTTNRGRDYK